MEFEDVEAERGGKECDGKRTVSHMAEIGIGWSPTQQSYFAIKMLIQDFVYKTFTVRLMRLVSPIFPCADLSLCCARCDSILLQDLTWA